MGMSLFSHRSLTVLALISASIASISDARAQPDDEISDEILEFDNGEMYVGQLRNELPDGTGVYTFANGDVFTGEWREGLMDGVGTFKLGTIEKPFLIINGTWRNGLLDGAIEIDLVSGFSGAHFSSDFINGVAPDDGKLTISGNGEGENTNNLYSLFIETLNMCSFIQFSSLRNQYENCIEVASSYYLENSSAPPFFKRLYQLTQQGLLKEVEENGVDSQRKYDWFHAQSAVLTEDLGIAISALNLEDWNFSEHNLLGMQPIGLTDLNIKNSSEKLSSCEEFSYIERIFNEILAQSTLQVSSLQQEINQVNDQAKRVERIFLDRTREQREQSAVSRLNNTQHNHMNRGSDVPLSSPSHISEVDQRKIAALNEQAGFYEARNARFSLMKQFLQRENSTCQEEALNWLRNAADDNL